MGDVRDLCTILLTLAQSHITFILKIGIKTISDISSDRTSRSLKQTVRIEKFTSRTPGYRGGCNLSFISVLLHITLILQSSIGIQGELKTDLEATMCSCLINLSTRILM